MSDGIPISRVKIFREHVCMTHLVVFGVDADGVQHVATHGETETHAREAAIAGNKLKSALGWPENLCKARPIERKCKNCSYFDEDRGTFTATGWTGSGGGYCMVEPTKTKRHGDDHACRHLLPT